MDEKALRGIIGSLLTARNDAKKQTTTFSPNMRTTYQVVVQKEGSFVLGSEGISCVDHAVELITSDNVLGERFSRAFIINKINGLILILLASSDQDLQAKTTENVNRLIQELEKAPILQWNMRLPIVNLVLKVPLVQIGRVEFALMDDAKLDSMSSVLKEINESSTSPEEVKRGFMNAVSELLQTRYLNKTVASVTVEAADLDSAVQHAEEEIEHALNALRFYGRAVMKNDARKYRMFIGADGTVFAGNRTPICLRPKQQFSLPSKHTGYLYPYEVDTETLGLIQKLRLLDLSNVLAKHERQRSGFEKLIATAVDLFGTAMNQANPREAYLNFVTSLESLLLKDNDPRGLLAERVAIIGGEGYEAREELFKNMEHIYDVRSRIVHSGFTDVTEDDVWLVSITAFHIIVTLIAMSEKINDIGKLVTACSKSKFGGPPFSPEPVKNVSPAK